MKNNQIYEMKKALRDFRELYWKSVCEREHLDDDYARVLRSMCYPFFSSRSHFLIFHFGSFSCGSQFSYNQSFETIYSKCCSLIVNRIEKIVKNWKI